jgi:alpha-glucosidase (family GH31 glycosyl hydrolase)
MQIFQNYNKGKKVNIVNFGNPIYNSLDRNSFTYNKERITHILLLPTLIKSTAIQKEYITLIEKIKDMGVNLTIKTHPMQSKYHNFERSLIIEKDIYQILKQKRFNLVISDNSTALLDAIFFKHRVLFFDPSEQNTVYSKYLQNIYHSKRLETFNDLDVLVDIAAQEKLLNYLAGGNSLNNQIIVH